MYAEGRGAGKDRKAAYMWIQAAAMAGDARGNEMLHRLENVLSAKEIAEAREQATRLLQPEHQLSAASFAP
jgi:TPR repeat protein